MKHGKMLLSLLLTLAMLLSMSVFALAEEVEGETAETPAEDAATEEVVEEEAAAKMTVRCVDADGATIRDQQEDYLDLSKDQVLDEKSTRPNIEGYTYQKTMVGTDEIVKLTVSHDDSGAVVTATVRQSGVESEKKLTGSETVLFVYEKAEEHTHSFDEGKVTTEPTCTEKGVKTFTCSCGETKTEEIPALGHDFAHGRCKRCDEKDPNFKPKLTDNTNGHASWGTDYKVTSDAARKDFQKVLIDGQELSSSNYSVAEVNGNTVVTVKGSAIKSLKVGQHSIAVVSETGTAQRNFSVSDKPKTGDADMALWTGLLLLSAMGAAAVTLTARKKFSAQ